MMFSRGDKILYFGEIFTIDYTWNDHMNIYANLDDDQTIFLEIDHEKLAKHQVCWVKDETTLNEWLPL